MRSTARGRVSSCLMVAAWLCACGVDTTPDSSAGGQSSVGAPGGGGTTSTGGMQPSVPAAGQGGWAGTAAVVPQPGAGSPAPVAGEGGGGEGTVVPPMARDVSYHKDIRPLMEARCLGCHVDGGSGPFPLDTWERIEPFGPLVVAAVTSRRMPPWLADDTDCTKVRDSQRLTDAQIALFTDWQASGFPLGNEADFVALPPPTQRDVGEPSMVIKATRPFQLSPGIEDYYCLATDARFTQDTWVTAMDLVPEHDQYVHHAIVNVGTTCSATGTLADNIYSYRPGARTLVFEEGDALLIRAGASIRIQFHYNTRYAPRGTALPTDHSAFRIWTLPPGQRPQRQITRMPHHDYTISIPVGAVNHREGGTTSIGSEYTRTGSEIIGISPHMHYLGKTFKETLRKANGTTICLIDIPAWDQNWQLDYFYEPSSFIPVARGDRVTQECVYSNRPEDQGTDPEGNRFTPQRTTFGEDTRNEMCLGYIWFRYPL
jgi:hypothetical protein